MNSKTILLMGDSIFNFGYLRLVLHRCIPVNFTSLIDIAIESNVNLSSIINPENIEKLENLIDDMEQFVEVSAVISEMFFFFWIYMIVDRF